MRDISNTGFVNFPDAKMLDTGKTFVYLVSIDCEGSDEFSGSTLKNAGVYVGNDVDTNNGSIALSTLNGKIDQLKRSVEKRLDSSFISTVLIGWSNLSYYKNESPWICGYQNLTHNGRQIYFGLKKLHYDKDIKILTFNHIK